MSHSKIYTAASRHHTKSRYTNVMIQFHAVACFFNGAHLFDLDRVEQMSWLWLPNQTVHHCCLFVLQISCAAC
jgi:hypothetical protein